MRTDLVLDALRMALHQRGPGADFQLVATLIAARNTPPPTYTQELTDHGVLASVGAIGDAYDNATAESFVDTFKTELIADRVWRSRSQLELAVVRIRLLFNNKRLHESLDDVDRTNVSPAEFGTIRSTGGSPDHLK
jgi:putative transposase